MKLMIEGLRSTIKGQEWKPEGTEWANYMSADVHSNDYLESKKKTVLCLVKKVNPGIILDLGANTGYFSRVAAGKERTIISTDYDPACVDINYQILKEHGEKNILTLVIDILNTSPPIGWNNTERLSFFERIKPDMISALALIHHLVFKGNISFEMIALMFSRNAISLLIEFVPLEDDKVKILLQNRRLNTSFYCRENFETVFSHYYNILDVVENPSNKRIIYLMKKK
jgi:hypothetical protein